MKTTTMLLKKLKSQIKELTQTRRSILPLSCLTNMDREICEVDALERLRKCKDGQVLVHLRACYSD